MSLTLYSLQLMIHHYLFERCIYDALKTHARCLKNFFQTLPKNILNYNLKNT